MIARGNLIHRGIDRQVEEAAARPLPAMQAMMPYLRRWISNFGIDVGWG
jgi:hypothetical protein